MTPNLTFLLLVETEGMEEPNEDNEDNEDNGCALQSCPWTAPSSPWISPKLQQGLQEVTQPQATICPLPWTGGTACTEPGGVFQGISPPRISFLARFVKLHCPALTHPNTGSQCTHYLPRARWDIPLR